MHTLVCITLYTHTLHTHTHNTLYTHTVHTIPAAVMAVYHSKSEGGRKIK